MTIHITITTDDKSEATGAFQLVSFLNQLDITGTGDGIVWTEQKPMSITVDWSGRVETIKDHAE
ncbi:MAG: hypothetical protein QF535_22785 [Anaerolineales bacterium]|nr:hypothetical protein [Anaerolineales bacterium]